MPNVGATDLKCQKNTENTQFSSADYTLILLNSAALAAIIIIPFE